MASAAQYHNIDTPLGELYRKTGFSNAVVLPAGAQIVITAGVPVLFGEQRLTATPAEQIESAFDNLDISLNAAGVKEGLWEAHKIQCWMTDVKFEPLMMEIWRRRWPGHQPTWATVGTSALCGKGMIVELQTEAHIMP